MKIGVDTREKPRHHSSIDRTEGIGPDWSTSRKNIMNIIHLHDVTNITTETNEYDEFSCENITIETKDGQNLKLKLFREKPEVEPVNETELLITSIKGALVRWGLDDYPDYEELVSELYHEATKPNRFEDLDFGASSFMECFSWKNADKGVSFWCAVYDWSVK